MTRLWLAFAALFLELAAPKERKEFVRRYAPIRIIRVYPVRPQPLTPERERLAQIHEVASRAIASRSTTDDKPALAMVEAISR